MTQQRFLKKSDADKKAEEVRKQIPEFTYTVQQASDKHWYIVVYDEDGEHIGVV